MRVKITCFVDVPDNFHRQEDVEQCLFDDLLEGIDVSLSYEKTDVPANSTQE